MSKWVCVNCEAANNHHATYCLSCGQTKADLSVIWVCPICAHDNPDKVTYCQKCRHWLLSADYEAMQVGGQVVKFQKVEQREPVISAIAKVEVVLLALVVVALIVRASGNITLAAPPIFIMVFGLHAVFTVLYVSRAFVRDGVRSAGRRFIWHGIVLFILLLMLGLMQG